MKTKTLALIIALFSTTTLFAQGKLTVSWVFCNIVEGYDHDAKCVVYIDGKEAASSTTSKESAKNSVTVNTTPGSHSVKVVNYALYEGNWEEHTIANEYSIDCTYEGDIKIGKKSMLSLLFDIDSGTTSTNKKLKGCPKKKK